MRTSAHCLCRNLCVPQSIHTMLEQRKASKLKRALFNEIPDIDIGRTEQGCMGYRPLITASVMDAQFLLAVIAMSIVFTS